MHLSAKGCLGQPVLGAGSYEGLYLQENP